MIFLFFILGKVSYELVISHLFLHDVFFSCMDVFLEALSQCSYLRLAIGLGTAVILEMYPTLELLFKYYFKLWSAFWNLQVKQFVYPTTKILKRIWNILMLVNVLMLTAF